MPYKSEGFVIDGFSTSKADWEILIRASLVPDSVIILNCAPDVAAKRLLPTRMRQIRDNQRVEKTETRENEEDVPEPPSEDQVTDELIEK